MSIEKKDTIDEDIGAYLVTARELELCDCTVLGCVVWWEGD